MDPPREPPDGAPRTVIDDRVSELLGLLGRRHALAILYVFARDPGPWRFTELQDRLDLSPNTLTRRLRELTDAGLLERRSYDEIPPRVEYAATDPAAELKPVFGAIYEWAATHGDELDPTLGDWDHEEPRPSPDR